MATCPKSDIVAAIAALLLADATFVDLATGGLFNDAPDDAAYPHVVIDYVSDRPAHRLGGAAAGIGWDVIVRVHTYSLYQGQLQALAISERVVDVLDFESLTITGFASAYCTRESGRAMTEFNKQKLETRHVVDEFRIGVRQ